VTDADALAASASDAHPEMHVTAISCLHRPDKRPSRSVAEF
jgi:hypothetical protein